MVHGSQIFLNAINTPWQKEIDYSIDFLGRNYNNSWWESEFQRYVNNHINLARIWIHGNGNHSPNLNGNGVVTGASSQFWADMDSLVAVAKSKKIYLLLTFWSFNMVQSTYSRFYTQYRKIINSSTLTEAYIDNFLVPFVKRYDHEQFIMGYDICNEPEHMWHDSDCGLLPRDNVIRFIAMCAAGIHQNTTKPVTVGSMWIIYNSDYYKYWYLYDKYAGNNYSDASLQAQYMSSYAYLDFYSPHWYQWNPTLTGAPFDEKVGYWVANANKPVVIEETPGYDITPQTANNYGLWWITMADYYKRCYWNGYAGVCGWKNPWENDGYGTFAGVASGTNAFYAAYPELVYPPAGRSKQAAIRGEQTSYSSNFPNPFNPSTTIQFRVPSSGFVSLKVYDALGREVATLVNGRENAGSHTVMFDATHLSSGVYFYRLQAENFVETKKMVLVK